MAEPWQPKATKEQTRETLTKYRLQPSLWDGKEKEIENLQKHAEYHRIPFARSKQHQDNFLVGAVKNFARGWGEGYSANILEFDTKPRDEAESIARQLGSLSGFVGYLPGGKLFKTIRAINAMTRGRSLPLRAATGAQKLVSKVGKPIVKESPTLRKIFTEESKVGDALAGAFHLGVASGVSDWRGIVDEGMPRLQEALITGGLFGGGFRLVGNLRGLGERLRPNQVDAATGMPIMSKLSAGQKFDVLVKSQISGLGDLAYSDYKQPDLPDSQRIYNYILGTYFGFNETPLQLRISRKAIAESVKEGYAGPDGIPDPELHPKWDTWTPEAQGYIKRDFEDFFGKTDDVKRATYRLYQQAMKNGNVTEQDMMDEMEAMIQQNMQDVEIGPDGKVVEPVSKADIKKVREIIKDNPNSEDYQDLDMHINDLANLPGKIAGSGGFVDRYIMPNMENPNVADRLVQSLRISKKWDSLHGVQQGVAKPKIGAVKEMYQWLQKTYKRSELTQQEKDWWRNWAEQTRKKKLVLQTYYADGKTLYIDKGVNVLGNKKELVFEPPKIEETYNILSGGQGGNFYTVFDHFVRKGKEYSLTDFNRLQNDLNKEKGKSKAENVIKQVKAKVMKDLESEGYYYVGGRGDKKAMYFIKQNPEAIPTAREFNLNMIKKAFIDSGMSRADYNKFFTAGKRAFYQKFPSARKNYYEDAIISNALYDVHNNYGPEARDYQAKITNMLKEGKFIGSAKAYNKRAQIWFNSGLSANSEVANEYLNKYYNRYKKELGIKGDFKPLRFFGNKGDFRVRGAIWDDSVHKGPDDNIVNRSNFDRPESFDGHISALPEFIYALNKANGLTNEGHVNKSFIVQPDSRHGAMLGKYMFHEASPELARSMRRDGVHFLAPESAIKQMGTRRFADILRPNIKDTYTQKDLENELTRLGIQYRKHPKDKTRIGEIYIPPELQRQGMGTRVAKMFERVARNEGRDKIRINAVAGRKKLGSADVDNVEFWKKQGYRVDEKAIKDMEKAGISREQTIGPNAFDPKMRGKKTIVMPMIKDVGKTNRWRIEGPTYDVNLSNIRTILSETTSKKDLENARFAKQLWSTIMHFGKNRTNPELVRGMANELIQNSVKGDDSINAMWDAHIKSPNRVSEMKVLEDIDSVSLDRLMNAVTDTNNEAFASKVYDKILKNTKESNALNAEDAEILKDDYFSALGEVSEFDSIIDRIGELYPQGNLGFYMHKMARNYRQNSVKNYIVDRISRPKLKNGMKARMRPWDQGMWNDDNLKRLETEQDIFFLDDGAKSKRIYDPFFKNGYETLGNIWKEVSNNTQLYKDNKEFYDDILEAVNMRVPMDSQSGAHVLRFQGFTGTQGHGVLLHGRAMEALGGADLDGDKAFIFFGGKSGIWKDWKEIWRGQYDEFVDKNGIMKNAKTKEAKALFTKQDKFIKDIGESKFSKYDPYWRLFMSEAAGEGRDTLGAAVTTRQSLAATYDALRFAVDTDKLGNFKWVRNSNNKGGQYLPTVIRKGSYYYPIEINKEGKVIYLKQTPKRNSVQKFKELARAAINLGADPMDEAGIVGVDKIKQILTDTLFDFEYQTMKTYGDKQDPKYAFTKASWYYKQKNNDKARELKAKDTMGGLQSVYGRLNNLLDGRNFATGKKFSLGEIQSGVNDVNWLPRSMRNNLVSYIADEYRKIPYEDNIFRRLDREALDDLYNFNRRSLSGDKDLLALFERTSMTSRMGPLIDNVINYRMYDVDERIKLANNKERFWDLFSREWHPQFDELSKGKKRNQMGRIPNHLYYTFTKNRKNTTKNDRLQYLEYKLSQAEDFVVNDLSDMASLKHIMEVKEKNNISDEEFKRVNAYVNQVKRDSYWVKKASQELIEDVREMGKEQGGKFDSERFLEMLGMRKKAGAGLDQRQIDNTILVHKKELRLRKLHDLYDAMLLGTFQKTNLELINKLESRKRLTDSEVKFLSLLRKHGQNTSLLRLGFASKSVKDKNVKAHLEEYNRLYKQITEPSKKDIDDIKDVGAGNEKDRPSSYNDEMGKMPEGKIIEAADLSEADRFYMDQIEPFKGLKSGKVEDPELMETMLNIEGHMKHYHNMDSRAFNGFFRSLFQKNINQATKFDLQNFDRVLSDMRNGSMFVRFINFVTGKSKKLPDIERRYWMRFPEANQREWLRYPGMMKWEKDVAPFKDRFNNSIVGEVVRPTTVIGDLQNYAYKTAEFSLQTAEEEINKLRDELAPYIQSHADGRELWRIAIPIRERGMVSLISEIQGSGSKMSHRQMEYIKNYEAVQPKYRQLKNKQYVIPLKDGNVKMSGDAIIKKINEIITNKNKDIAKYINGDIQFMDKFLKLAYNRNGQLTWYGVDAVTNKWIKYSKEKFRKGEKMDISKFGINGIMEISKLAQIRYSVPKRKRTDALLKRLSGQLGVGMKRTDLWDPEVYFPHAMFDRVKVEQSLSKALDSIFANKKMTKAQKFKNAKEVIYQSHTMTGDWAPKSISEENYNVMSDMYSKMSEAVGREKKQKPILPGKFKKAYSQYQRDSHIGGWSIEPEAYEKNMKNLIDTFYKESMLSLSRMHIQEFHRKFLKQTKDNKLATRWGNFLKLFTQSAMGHPIDIPENIMNDSSYKLSMTPYKWFADSENRKRIDFIREKLGLEEKSLKKYGMSRKDVPELQDITQNQLQYWSGLEAKWQMASLLAHPKSAITNLFGGTIHTGISAGIDNLRKARDIDYLKTNINPNWRSMRDVEKWVESLGIVEEFLLYEAGLNKEIRGKRMNEFIKDATQKLKRNPEYSDVKLRELAREHKITDSMWNKASWFMRRPERTLRRDAFLAHYIKARQEFKGAIRDYDHPFLIEMGRKGVKATQFLYSAPFRPMWTNSAMGRVMSRFQLWSWNSVRFRKDVLEEARKMGYQPGTPEYERAKRLIQADLMVYALSSMFMYSLFDNALPAPYNWFQDTADFLFGEDEDRERAFFGAPSGPLSILKPPAFRFNTPIWEGLVNGNWDKMTDYYIYTLLPFGRIIKDVVGPGGFIENPFYAVEKMTGVPYIALGNKVKEATAGNREVKGLFADLY